MTDKIRAEVTDIEEGVSSRGKPFWKIVTDKGLFFVWDKKLRDQVRTGRLYEFGCTGDEYVKITDVFGDFGLVAKPAPGQQALQRYVKNGAEEQARILRSVALKCAVEAHQELMSGDDTAAYSNHVLDLADAFLAWLQDSEASEDEEVV